MTDVAVIGAGVIGASVAYHLARRGLSVTVLERGGAPGEGSTGRATGGFRAQFATGVNVRLSLLSRAKLCAFREETGGDAGYVPAGYLWLARDEAQLAVLRAALEVQRAAGLEEARIVSDVAALNPFVRGGVAGAAFCPTDGFVRPLGIARGYLEAAQRLGVRLRRGVEVRALTVAQGRVTAVRAADGELACGAVVNAAGPWAAEVAALAGVALPVRAERRCVLPTVATAALPAEMPMTIWLEDGFHLRVRDGRVLLLMPGDDAGWAERVGRTARERVPALREVALDEASAWSGLYELSPDRHAILGAAPGCANFWLCNGSSGHGVMHAPALGQLLAELITGAPPTLDVHPLRPSRFAEGAAISAPSLL